jgi:hypothetical protein
MKHVLQVLIFAVACGAGAAHDQEKVHKATTSGINQNTNTLTAFNFPKITYAASAGASRAEQRADEAIKRNIDVNAKTWTAFNFPKITFV